MHSVGQLELTIGGKNILYANLGFIMTFSLFTLMHFSPAALVIQTDSGKYINHRVEANGIKWSFGLCLWD